MKYIGIDLGTTNSVICSYDGESVQLYKSPDQQDVTPSAISIDKRGNKHVGLRAYNTAARDPDNSAILFKRFMGTSTPQKLVAANLSMTPEECSAEILRVMFGYLPEDIRNSPDTGTVITVPAAFNQMQKDATMKAAQMAGLGSVALMQEPVAAVMSVMRQRKGDGTFIVYDLGGGTLDVAIAESSGGRVSLQAHGGIAMCGGRDFDRIIFDNVVKPWLRDKFDLPEDISGNAKFKPLWRMATWAAEKAKIELSQRENAMIALTEAELGMKDLSDNEMYIEIPLSRTTLDELIAPKIEESINAVRETLDKAGLSSHDVERVVFVGGPTQYKPLRDKVAFELGVASSTDVNPMVAVAEGAAIFAESIDWNSQSRGRKDSRGAISADGKLNLSFSFTSRTPDSKAKIVAKLANAVLPGTEFQIQSLDTGWSSGRVALKDGAAVDLVLSKPGENTFKIFVFDAAGGPLTLDNNKIVINMTAASVDSIPSSSSIGIEALNKIGGGAVLDYLVKDGEPLPTRGKKIFKAGESLRSGSTGAINFKVWEGDIEDNIGDNLFIGAFTITGEDFDDGVIAAGADLEIEYEILDSGNIVLKVSVPSISASFNARNFYSPKSALTDYSAHSKRVVDEAEKMRSRLDAISKKVDDKKLDSAIEKVDHAAAMKDGDSDPEAAKQASDGLQDAKKLLAQVRKDNLKDIRQVDLDSCLKYFDDVARKFARPAEANSFDSLVNTAKRVISQRTPDFEIHLKQMWGKIIDILHRQDWFIIDRFKWLSDDDHLFMDKAQHQALVKLGKEAIQADDIDKLRGVVGQMDVLRIRAGSDSDMLTIANIVKG